MRKWYKDRSFPEIKGEVQNAPPDIIAVVEKPEHLDRLIEEHNAAVEESFELVQVRQQKCDVNYFNLQNTNLANELKACVLHDALEKISKARESVLEGGVYIGAGYKDHAVVALDRAKILKPESEIYKIEKAAVAKEWEHINSWKPFFHCCPDWDFLPIDRGDREFEACQCYPRKNGEPIAPKKPQIPRTTPEKVETGPVF